MVSWREVAVDDLADQGAYRTVLPEPAQFVLPRGVFLVVEGEDLAGEAADVGCCGIRRLDDQDGQTTFEVKHLYLQPHLRGSGAGRALLQELERRAVALGAQRLVLDTNDSLTAAGGLYRSSGYIEVAPYNDNANATTWYAKSL